MKKLFIVFALVLTSAAAQAVEKRYVTDTLWLQLRSGPSQEYRILKALQSGEHLIFISEDEIAMRGSTSDIISIFLQLANVERLQSNEMVIHAIDADSLIFAVKLSN